MWALFFTALLLVSFSLYGGSHVASSRADSSQDVLQVVSSATVTVAGHFNRHQSPVVDRPSDFDDSLQYQIPPPTQPTPSPSPIVLDEPTLNDEDTCHESSCSLDREDPRPDFSGEQMSAASPLLPVASPSLNNAPTQSMHSTSSNSVITQQVHASSSSLESSVAPYSSVSQHASLPSEHHCSPHQSALGQCGGGGEQALHIASSGHAHHHHQPPASPEIMPTDAGDGGSVVDITTSPSETSETRSVAEDESVESTNDTTATESSPEAVSEEDMKAESIPPVEDNSTAGAVNVSQDEASEDDVPIVAPTPVPEPEEDLLSFEEWKKKKEESARNEQDDAVQQVAEVVTEKHKNGNGKSAKLVSSQQNFANVDCGAKVVSANPEAQNWKAILEGNRDVYLLNPCSAKIWFVVELCDEVLLQTVEMANFEMFSSSPKNFTISTSDRFPTREWTTHGVFQANDTRDIQVFELPKHVYAKYVKIEVVSHHGTEHFCPISLFRVKATSMVQEYQLAEEIAKDADGSQDDELISDNAQYPEAELDIVHRAKHVVMNLLSSLLADDANKTEQSEDSPPVEPDVDVASSPAPAQNLSESSIEGEESKGSDTVSATTPPAEDENTSTVSSAEDQDSKTVELPTTDDKSESPLSSDSSADNEKDNSASVVDGDQGTTSLVISSAVAPSTSVDSENPAPDSAGTDIPVPSPVEAPQASPTVSVSEVHHTTEETDADGIASTASPSPDDSAVAPTVHQDLSSSSSVSGQSDATVSAAATTTPPAAEVEPGSDNVITPPPTPVEMDSAAEDDVPPAAVPSSQSSDSNDTNTTAPMPGNDTLAATPENVTAPENETHAAMNNGSQSPQAPPTKESVFIRLNNRIKSLDNRLDANVTLIQHYLDELSASFNRFKKNMSEFQRSNEARLQRLNESLMVMEEQLDLAVKSNRNIEEHVGNLTATVLLLTEELLNVHDQALSHLATCVIATVAIMAALVVAFLVVVSCRLSTVSHQHQQAISGMITLVQRIESTYGGSPKPNHAPRFTPPAATSQLPLPSAAVPTVAPRVPSDPRPLRRASSLDVFYDNDSAISENSEWIPVAGRPSRSHRANGSLPTSSLKQNGHSLGRSSRVTKKSR